MPVVSILIRRWTDEPTRVGIGLDEQSQSNGSNNQRASIAGAPVHGVNLVL